MRDLCCPGRCGNSRLQDNLCPFFLPVTSRVLLFSAGSVMVLGRPCPILVLPRTHLLGILDQVSDPSGDLSFPICTVRVWARTRDFHILGVAALESWGRWTEWAAPSVFGLHIVVLGKISFEKRICCYKTAWKLLSQETPQTFFPGLTFYFSTNCRTLGTRVKEQGRLHFPVGAKLLGEEVEMGATRWC